MVNANKNSSENNSNSKYAEKNLKNIEVSPSDLLGRRRIPSGYLKRLDNKGGGRAYEFTRQRKILSRIASEPVPPMALIVQELDDGIVVSTKNYLRKLITTPGLKGEFVSLQRRLDGRADLTNESLLKCHKIQLEFFVAIKTGLGDFLSEKNCLPTTEMAEVFLLQRCRNIDCRRLLPVEDCRCEICSTKKGFCSKCMCLVCLKFDSASNTCGWVSCDACLHWCHAVCGIRQNLIKPGPSLKGPPGTTEMQFYCLGCGHASEMFGFVKDVFTSCAKEWCEETLMKELECVRKIFQGSEDLKGKELHVKADVVHTKLVTKMISPSDACDSFFQFFSGIDGLSDFSGSNFPAVYLPASLGKHAVTGIPASTSLIPESSLYDASTSRGRKDMRSVDPCANDVNTIDDERFVKPSKNDEVYCLGSILRFKEAEALMYQRLADEARREAGSYRRLVMQKSEKIQEEYSEKLSKLCLQETEEKRRKKSEELKALEDSYSDYMRIYSEIVGLLRKIEEAKPLLV